MRNLQDILDSNTVKLQNINILSDIDTDSDINFDNISTKTINNNIDVADMTRKNIRQIIIRIQITKRAIISQPKTEKILQNL